MQGILILFSFFLANFWRSYNVLYDLFGQFCKVQGHLLFIWFFGEKFCKVFEGQDKEKFFRSGRWQEINTYFIWKCLHYQFFSSIKSTHKYESLIFSVWFPKAAIQKYYFYIYEFTKNQVSGQKNKSYILLLGFL